MLATNMQSLILVFVMAAWAGDADPEIWFSHKRHAALKLECTYCHAGAKKAMRAGMPAAGRCLLCHKSMPASSTALKRLVRLPAAARPFKAEYDNLPDYVRFSHAKHARGKTGCAECHGDMSQQEQTEPANALNMKACVDCHTLHKATTACGVCHSIR